MTKTNQTKQTCANSTECKEELTAQDKAAAEKRQKNETLQRALANAESAFKEQGKAAKTLTKSALEVVVAYFNLKRSVDLDKDLRADLRARWLKYNDSKFESGVFYRVAKTCANNAETVVECIDHAEKEGKDTVQTIRDRFLAIGLSLTSCKTYTAPTEQATESAPTEQTTAPTAPTEKATATEQTTDKLRNILDFIATCNVSSLTAIKNAVAKRETVDRKLQATA